MHVVTELGARPCTLCVPQPFGEFLHDSLQKILTKLLDLVLCRIVHFSVGHGRLPKQHALHLRLQYDQKHGTITTDDDTDNQISIKPLDKRQQEGPEEGRREKARAK